MVKNQPRCNTSQNTSAQMRHDSFHTPSARRTRMDGWVCAVLVCVLLTCGEVWGAEYELGDHPRFICTPIPPDAPCPSSASTGHRGDRHYGEHQGEHHSRHHSGRYTGYHSDSLFGESDDATPTILHLRESLVQQKETILDQRETIRELTSKLALCQGLGHGLGGPEHGHAQYRRYHTNREHTGDTGETISLSHSSSPEQMSHMLETLKERLENLQMQNTSTAYSVSLKELLRRKIAALEQRLLHHTESIDDVNHPHGDNEDDDVDHHDGQRDGNDNRHAEGSPPAAHHSQDRSTTRDELDKVLKKLTHGSRTRSKSSRSFQIGFPMRTNYMYSRVKRTVNREMYAMTLCMWLKGGASGIGTPFSYSVPGQANELVLIEWGDKPMELLIKDTAVILPLSLHDGKWHHMCVTWLARDGIWEVYQDGAKRGSGENLNAWQPIKPGGVFILGQEQDSLGGRFDATQAFVGEISDLQLWSHTLTHHDIYSLASCHGHMTGDIISWAESVVELHGGITKYPFDPCH
ncbi:neuronal pentraxin-2 isoform X2 [Silurus meridionalis]|uniref:neuronal pentraxin-2 isoform X2 n=1 Tax=Silurus meridionalis TaxID=175797 RepID=UPI001EEB5F7E|nr:neuronal pentraxin-2 isoform X2 [Silurus meridionalis]